VELNKIYNIDVIKGLNQLDDNSVDLIITSPPYNLSISYSDNTDSLTYDDYLAWADKWIYYSKLALKPDGRICINVPMESNLTGKRFMASDYINLLEASGMIRMANITWDKQNLTKRTAWGSWKSPSCPCVNTPLECILVYCKETKKHLGRKEDIDITRDEFILYTLGVWKMSPAKKSKVGHPAPFPEELPYRCMKLFSYRNDLVLDPFVGSGTTAVVAKKLGRRFVGFDLSKDYVDMSNSNLDSVVVNEV
jgi:site-specific DNA-methyltransferase (adenine-specific)